MKPLTKSEAALPEIGDALVDLLAYKLLHLGARTKVVVALTDLNEKRVRKLLKAITGGGPLIAGPCPLPRAEFFIGGLKRNPTANVHSTLFLAGYVHLEIAFLEELHPGYLLAAAFEAYCETLPMLPSGAPVLDINRAYALVRYHLARELVLVRCRVCDAPHLLLTTDAPNTQACPICQKTHHCRFLAEISRLGGNSRKSAKAS